MGEPICTWAFGSSLRNSSAKDCPAPACVQGDFGLAAGTDSKVISDEENADLAVIEAKLADEMIGLGNFLKAFALRTKAIREEIPDSAQFCKLVAGFFPLMAFQLSEAFLCPKHRFTFQDDGALYLQQLGLKVNDFAREIDLEGRKFLAVALLDHGAADVRNGFANRDRK